MMRIIGLIILGLMSVSPLWAQSKNLKTEIEFTAAVIKEQEVTFAVVLVKSEVFNDKNVADEIIETMEPSFGNIPVVLMIQDDTGRPSYYGRTDLAEFLSNVPLESIPWKQYALQQNQDGIKF